MIASLSETNRRTLALTILLTLVALFLIGIVMPLQKHFADYDTSIEQLEFRLGKLQQIARLQAPLKNQLKQLQVINDKSRDLIKGKSEALAGANLQELSKEVLRSTGSRLESSQMLPVIVEEKLQRITLRIQFSATIATLQRVLYTLESNRPLLFIEEISIKTRQTRRTQQRSNNIATPLEVTLDLFGYQKIGGQQR
ncbi:MAG: type II secretion system protein GspM [Candidatus Polarisedimenticolaceae bacterium]|nr:type II secretion system protein GspM [Candidatus Polarisedimenticolaceae bacterium]